MRPITLPPTSHLVLLYPFDTHLFLQKKTHYCFTIAYPRARGAVSPDRKEEKALSFIQKFILTMTVTTDWMHSLM